MKILIINSFYYPNMVGGAEHSVKNLAETLVKKGNEVSVLCIDGYDREENINGVNIFRMSNVNIKNSIEYNNSHNNKISKIIYRGLDLYGHTNLFKVKRVLDKVKPDIVHINNIPGFGIGMFKLLYKKNIPTIFTARDYYTICTNSTLINSRGDICEYCSKVCNIYRYINKVAIKNADYVTAPSQFTIDKLRKIMALEKDKTVCIYNSIDIDKKEINEVFNNKKNNLINKKDLDIVFLGKLDEHKGIKLLLENIIEMNDNTIKLHIAGDGPLKEVISNASRVNDNIHYHGKLNKEELGDLLKKCDVLAAPSLWYEPFGRIVLDAYKYSMPVITTGNGGLAELVIDNETGYVVDIRDKETFSRAIYKYKNKDLLLEQMEKCKNQIDKYSNEVIIEKYENLYKKLIKN